MIRVLQFGAKGQLATEIVRHAPRHAVQLRTLDRTQADFLRPDGVLAALAAVDNIDLVVNATAYTAVDKAESDHAAAQTINADTVGRLAQACAARGLPLIHVSTDYVFDGEKAGPYIETDRTRPLSVYGRTKLAGEEAIRASGVRHAILRTSWVYGVYGTNFLKTMLRLGAERDELRIVDDQLGAPTASGELADAVLRVAQALVREPARPDQTGTFHCTGAGETTWRRFAGAIFAEASGWANIRARVTPIATKDYPVAAARPANSRLDCGKLSEIFGIRLRPWHAAMKDVLMELQTEARGA